MNNPELYHRSNILQKRDARQCLEEYGKEIKWKKYGATIIDIGCGDGSVTTDVLKTFIPNNYKELVGCDISEKMIEFATAHHARDYIRFSVLDIESDLPDKLREKFDHAFSFYALNWINHQKTAFSNIYDLLARGGDCLLMVMGHIPVYDIWRELSRAPRWSYWMRDVDLFVSPYHDCQHPEMDIKMMMTTIGFTNVEVKCIQKLFVYTEIGAFKNFIHSVNPFKIPPDMLEEFLEDYLRLVRDMKLVDFIFYNNADGTSNLLLIVEILQFLNLFGPKGYVYKQYENRSIVKAIFIADYEIYWNNLTHAMEPYQYGSGTEAAGCSNTSLLVY